MDYLQLVSPAGINILLSSVNDSTFSTAGYNRSFKYSGVFFKNVAVPYPSTRFIAVISLSPNPFQVKYGPETCFLKLIPLQKIILSSPQLAKMVGICALKPNVSGKYPIFISSPYFLESLIPIIKLRIKDSSSKKCICLGIPRTNR